jgi:alpha-2-macroglobulin
LTRARERNFAVPSQAFEQALDRLRNEVVNTPEPNKDNAAAIAYALYVLARNGRPVIGDLRYLTDAKLEGFTTPLAKAQLAAALAMLGDQARAANAFGAALKALDGERDEGVSRPDYGSRLRDAAAVLALVAEANLGNLESDAITRVGAVLEQARAVRSYLSTQEMNWMTLAAEALAEHASLAQFRVNDQAVKGGLYRRWSGPALAGQSIVIANAGQNSAQLVVSVSGAPIEPDPATAKGYAVERSFYKLDGTKLDALQSMAQNERVVVALKVTEAQARYARLLVVDRLPAGLEIDNPALVDGGSVEAFSWLSKDVEPAHTEYRDDRFVAAFDRADGQSAFITMAYVVRAVAPGRYIYPPATAEDMYDPERYGRTGFGELEVKAK